MADRVAKLCFVIGVLALIFLAGCFVGWRKAGPVSLIEDAYQAYRDWRKHWRTYLAIEPSKFLVPARLPGRGVTVYLSGRAQPGVTLISGIWDGDVGLSLRAMDGTELHRWRARYSELEPYVRSLPADQRPTNDWDTHVDAMVLYPNGDVIFNFGGFALVRMDRCNRVVWWRDYATHHSLAPDDEGNIWAAGHKRPRHEVADPRFPGLGAPYVEDTLIRFAPADGRILREISLLEAIYNSDYETALFPSGTTTGKQGIEDPLHLNHVEALPAAMAPAFPLFAAGDLLVSVREPSMILVIDAKTERIKWSRVGPWFGQHDPHFLRDGKISLVDNHDVINRNHEARASRIVTLDPVSGKTSIVFQGSVREPFFTSATGRHQYQPNGNILITESWGGRLLEVTPQGDKVWEFINRFDDTRAALMEWAVRYPPVYAEFPKDCAAAAEMAERPT